MRPVLLAIIVLALAGSASAAPRCASPAEVKLLKAAVLEQVLTAASQSCHLDGEFSRFVTAYHSGMLDSDRALKAFFASRTAAESYDAYKARIAEAVALKSLHDPKFCADANTVFAIALRHDTAAPPVLIPTGYEDCRVPPAAQQPPKLVVLLHRNPPPPRIETRPAEIRPAPVVAKPAPRPRIQPEKRVAKAVAQPPSKPVPHEAHLAVAAKAEKPLRITAALHPIAAPVTHVAAIPAAPASQPSASRPPASLSLTHSLPAPMPETSAVPRAEPAVPAKIARTEAAPPSDADEVDDESPYRPGDNIPNAYKPGATWVRTDLPREPVPPADYQPRPPAPNLYLGIDNRWHLIPAHHRRWGE